MVEIIKGKEKTLEKSLDELIIVYTQPQQAYIEMAQIVPVVKLVRLTGKFGLEEFMEILGENKTPTRGIIFDDVSWQFAALLPS